MNKFCIIAGLQFENQTDFKESFEETCSLAEACGYEVIETMVQPRRSAHPFTLFGSGKLAELQTLIHETKIDTLIISCDITPSQMRTLKDLFENPHFRPHGFDFGDLRVKSTDKGGSAAGRTGNLEASAALFDPHSAGVLTTGRCRRRPQ